MLSENQTTVKKIERLDFNQRAVVAGYGIPIIDYKSLFSGGSISNDEMTKQIYFTHDDQIKQMVADGNRIAITAEVLASFREMYENNAIYFKLNSPNLEEYVSKGLDVVSHEIVKGRSLGAYGEFIDTEKITFKTNSGKEPTKEEIALYCISKGIDITKYTVDANLTEYYNNIKALSADGQIWKANGSIYNPNGLTTAQAYKIYTGIRNEYGEEAAEKYFNYYNDHGAKIIGFEEADRRIAEINKFCSENEEALTKFFNLYLLNKDINSGIYDLDEKDVEKLIQKSDIRTNDASKLAKGLTEVLRFGKVVDQSLIDGLEGWGVNLLNLFCADGRMSSRDYEIQNYCSHLAVDTEFGGLYTPIYEIGSSIGNMLPSIVSTMIVGALTGGLGTSALIEQITKVAQFATSFATMGLSAAGGAKESAMQEGMSEGLATIYGLLSGLSEVALEAVLGSLPGISMFNDALDNATGLAGFFAKMLSEGLEESTQEVFDALLTSAFTGEPVNIDPEQVLKAGIYGAITSGVMSSAGAVTTGTLAGINIVIDGVKCTLTNSPSALTYITEKYQGLSLSEKLASQELKNDLLHMANIRADIEADAQKLMNSKSFQQEFERAKANNETSLKTIEEYALNKAMESAVLLGRKTQVLGQSLSEAIDERNEQVRKTDELIKERDKLAKQLGLDPESIENYNKGDKTFTKNNDIKNESKLIELNSKIAESMKSVSDAGAKIFDYYLDTKSELSKLTEDMALDPSLKTKENLARQKTLQDKLTVFTAYATDVLTKNYSPSIDYDVAQRKYDSYEQERVKVEQEITKVDEQINNTSDEAKLTELNSKKEELLTQKEMLEFKIGNQIEIMNSSVSSEISEINFNIELSEQAIGQNESKLAELNEEKLRKNNPNATQEELKIKLEEMLEQKRQLNSLIEKDEAIIEQNKARLEQLTGGKVVSLNEYRTKMGLEPFDVNSVVQARAVSGDTVVTGGVQTTTTATNASADNTTNTNNSTSNNVETETTTSTDTVVELTTNTGEMSETELSGVGGGSEAVLLGAELEALLKSRGIDSSALTVEQRRTVLEAFNDVKNSQATNSTNIEQAQSKLNEVFEELAGAATKGLEENDENSDINTESVTIDNNQTNSGVQSATKNNYSGNMNNSFNLSNVNAQETISDGNQEVGHIAEVSESHISTNNNVDSKVVLNSALELALQLRGIDTSTLNTAKITELNKLFEDVENAKAGGIESEINAAKEKYQTAIKNLNNQTNTKTESKIEIADEFKRVLELRGIDLDKLTEDRIKSLVESYNDYKNAVSNGTDITYALTMLYSKISLESYISNIGNNYSKTQKIEQASDAILLMNEDQLIKYIKYIETEDLKYFDISALGVEDISGQELFNILKNEGYFDIYFKAKNELNGNLQTSEEVSKSIQSASSKEEIFDILSYTNKDVITEYLLNISEEEQNKILSNIGKKELTNIVKGLNSDELSQRFNLGRVLTRSDGSVINIKLKNKIETTSGTLYVYDVNGKILYSESDILLAYETTNNKSFIVDEVLSPLNLSFYGIDSNATNIRGKVLGTINTDLEITMNVYDSSVINAIIDENANANVIYFDQTRHGAETQIGADQELNHDNSFLRYSDEELYSYINTESFNRMAEMFAKKYNISKENLIKLIQEVVNKQEGACSYADVANMIFSKFKNKSRAFKQIFGFDMYEYQDGVKTLNGRALLLDIYIKTNIGSIFEVNQETKELVFKNVTDSKTGLIRPANSKEQVYMSTHFGYTKEAIEYLSSYGIESNSEVVNCSSFFDSEGHINETEFAKMIKTRLANGEILSMGEIAKSDFIRDEKGKIVEDENGEPKTKISPDAHELVFNSLDTGKVITTTFNWAEGGSHATTIIGATDEGLIVITWGEKCLIKYSDLYSDNFSIFTSSMNSDVYENTITDSAYYEKISNMTALELANEIRNNDVDLDYVIKNYISSEVLQELVLIMEPSELLSSVRGYRSMQALLDAAKTNPIVYNNIVKSINSEQLFMYLFKGDYNTISRIFELAPLEIIKNMYKDFFGIHENMSLDYLKELADNHKLYRQEYVFKNILSQDLIEQLVKSDIEAQKVTRTIHDPKLIKQILTFAADAGKLSEYVNAFSSTQLALFCLTESEFSTDAKIRIIRNMDESLIDQILDYNFAEIDKLVEVGRINDIVDMWEAIDGKTSEEINEIFSMLDGETLSKIINKLNEKGLERLRNRGLDSKYFSKEYLESLNMNQSFQIATNNTEIVNIDESVAETNSLDQMSEEGLTSKIWTAINGKTSQEINAYFGTLDENTISDFMSGLRTTEIDALRRRGLDLKYFPREYIEGLNLNQNVYSSSSKTEITKATNIGENLQNALENNHEVVYIETDESVAETNSLDQMSEEGLTSKIWTAINGKTSQEINAYFGTLDENTISDFMSGLRTTEIDALRRRGLDLKYFPREYVEGLNLNQNVYSSSNNAEITKATNIDENSQNASENNNEVVYIETNNSEKNINGKDSINYHEVINTKENLIRTIEENPDVPLETIFAKTSGKIVVEYMNDILKDESVTDNRLIELRTQLNQNKVDLKREILNQVDSALDPITKMRQLYIELSKRVAYDSRWLVTNTIELANYNKQLTFKNLEEQDTNEVICYGWSQLYKELLIECGIDESDIFIPDRLHHWVEVDLKNYLGENVILVADSTSNYGWDLNHCKFGEPTNGFVIIEKPSNFDSRSEGKQTYNGTRICPKTDDIFDAGRAYTAEIIESIDEFIGYSKDGKYSSELIEEVKDLFADGKNMNLDEIYDVLADVDIPDGMGVEAAKYVFVNIVYYLGDVEENIKEFDIKVDGRLDKIMFYEIGDMVLTYSNSKGKQLFSKDDFDKFLNQHLYFY